MGMPRLLTTTKSNLLISGSSPFTFTPFTVIYQHMSEIFVIIQLMKEIEFKIEPPLDCSPYGQLFYVVYQGDNPHLIRSSELSYYYMHFCLSPAIAGKGFVHFESSLV